MPVEKNYFGLTEDNVLRRSFFFLSLLLHIRVDQNIFFPGTCFSRGISNWYFIVWHSSSGKNMVNFMSMCISGRRMVASEAEYHFHNHVCVLPNFSAHAHIIQNSISFLSPSPATMGPKSFWNRIRVLMLLLCCKVPIFWEGHKILQNIHLTFVLCSASQR